mgnify:FL=1
MLFKIQTDDTNTIGVFDFNTLIYFWEGHKVKIRFIVKNDTPYACLDDTEYQIRRVDKIFNENFKIVYDKHKNADDIDELLNKIGYE